MDEIVKEIVKIDARIYDKKNQSEEQVKRRKEYYEKEMADYSIERLAHAEEKAKASYDNIIAAAKQQYEFEEEKAKQMCLLIENRYLQIESQLLDEVFNKIFAVEA